MTTQAQDLLLRLDMRSLWVLSEVLLSVCLMISAETASVCELAVICPKYHQSSHRAKRLDLSPLVYIFWVVFEPFLRLSIYLDELHMFWDHRYRLPSEILLWSIIQADVCVLLWLAPLHLISVAFRYLLACMLALRILIENELQLSVISCALEFIPFGGLFIWLNNL